MPRKRHSPEEIVGKLGQRDVLTSQGRVPRVADGEEWLMAAIIELAKLHGRCG